MPEPGATRRDLEMERGRHIAGRAKRQTDLARYIQGMKVKIMVAMPGHAFYENKGRVNLFYVDEVCVAHQNEMDDDYPSEGVMAVLALSVGATVGFEGIPPAETLDAQIRARRNEYRDRHLGHWRDK